MWRNAEEKYHASCIVPTMKFGGVGVMFWGCFGWNGVGPLEVVEGTMDSTAYVNILAQSLIPWLRQQDGLIFQHDGAPCHKSEYTTWWMETHNIPVLPWVGQSPDLNPIEHLWDHLDRQVRRQIPLPKNKNELIIAVKEEWQNISIDTIRALISSMTDRIKAVIKADGSHTSY